MNKKALLFLVAILITMGIILSQRDDNVRSEEEVEIPHFDSDDKSISVNPSELDSQLYTSLKVVPNQEKEFNPFSPDSRPASTQNEEDIAKEEMLPFDDFEDEDMLLFEVEQETDESSSAEIQDFGIPIDDPMTYAEPESNEEGEVQDYGELIEDPLTYESFDLNDDGEEQNYGELIEDPMTYEALDIDDGEEQDYGELLEDPMAGDTGFKDDGIDADTEREWLE